MTIHDGFRELAATAIDFELDSEERAELDRHLAECASCRRTAEAFREDAATIANGAGPRLESGRSVAILAAALRPARSGPPVRLIAIVALVAVLGGGLLAAGMAILRRSDNSNVAVLSPSPSNPSSPPASGEASPQPTGSGGTPQPPAPTQRPVGSPIVGAIQVRGNGQELGTLIRMAPGPAADLYVSIPASDGTVLGRVDATGAPAPGWPVFLPGSELCDQLLPVASGSVRVLCHRPAAEDGLGGMITRVHAFDANGRPLPGWPVEIDDVAAGRMVGDDLTLLVKPYLGDVSEPDTPEPVFLGIVAADGTSRRGVEVPFECCEHSWAIAPDGTGYGTTHRDWDTSVKTDIEAFGTDGLRAGWPLTIEGNLSELAFDAAGRVHAVMGSPNAEPARTLVWDRDGRPLPGSSDQSIVSTNPWSGAGADYPGPPVVAADGTSFIVGSLDKRFGVYAFDPSGQGIAGWPYDSGLAFQDTGFCPPGDTGCGGFRTAPAVGPGNVLYLVHAPAKASIGGSIVALGRDGSVIEGWPVTLTRQGSEFWSVVVGPDSTAYAMAVEPEPNGSHSATILAIAPNSDVVYKVTIVEP